MSEKRKDSKAEESGRRRKQAGRRSRRLRKQPKVRRMNSSTMVAMPQMPLPKTARRRRRRNQRRWRISTAALRRYVFSARWISMSLLLLTAYGLALTGLDLHFYLTYIPVEGALSIPPAEIVDASGLAGAHVFAADPHEAAAQIDELPGVVSATVTLNWPNQVWVEVVEDSPVAVWQEGEHEFWVTADGRLIPARMGSLGLLVIKPEVLPVLVTVDEGDVVSDETVGGETAVVDETAVDVEDMVASQTPFIAEDILAGALQLQALLPELTTLSYRPATGLTFIDERGWEAHFGTGTDMQQKMRIYESVVAQLEAQEQTPEYISVSHREKPYYKAR